MTPEELETWARANPWAALAYTHSRLPQPLLEELARKRRWAALRNAHSRLPQPLLEELAREWPETALEYAHSRLPQPLLEELARKAPGAALRNAHSRLPQSLLEELADPWRLDPVPLSEVGKLMDWCTNGIVDQMEKAGLGRRDAYPRALLLAAAREAVKQGGHDKRWDTALDILERTTAKEVGHATL